MSAPRSFAALALIGCVLAGGHALAQPLPPSTLPPSTLPPAHPREVLGPDMHMRAFAGGGGELYVGPRFELNGDKIEDSPSSAFGFPDLVVRGEIPLNELVLVGLQGVLFLWMPDSEIELGYGSHISFDMSAVPKLRLAIGSRKRHEISLAVPLGPTIDVFEETNRRELVAQKVSGPVGFHVGVTAGYTYVPPTRWLGFFVEVGGTYHRITKSFRYASGATDELVYQPISLFVHGGAMLKIPTL